LLILILVGTLVLAYDRDNGFGLACDLNSVLTPPQRLVGLVLFSLLLCAAPTMSAARRTRRSHPGRRRAHAGFRYSSSLGRLGCRGRQARQP
jgi:hypothetical protein